MRDIAIIGTPVDLGAGRRGVDMGPSAIRYAGLKERRDGCRRLAITAENADCAARVQPHGHCAS